MKIERISLVNFRNHADTHIDLDRLTVICGPNAAGKSSLRQAAEVALTGRCEATDRGGKGLGDLLRVGEKKGSTSLFIQGLGEVVRTISPSGSSLQVADWSGSLKVQQELLYRELGTDADQIAAILNVGHFLDLPPKEQREMIFAVAGITLPAGEFMGLVNTAGEQAGMNLLDALREEIQLPEHISPGWLEAAYKQLYGARKEAKKDRDALAARLEGMGEAVEIPEGLPAPEDLPAMREQLEGLEAKREELQGEIAGHVALRKRREILERTISDTESDLKSLEATQGESEEGLDIDALRDEMEKVAADLSKTNARSHEFAGEIKAIDAALPKIKKATGECPLAPELVKCNTTKEDRKALVADLKEKRGKLVKAHERAMKKAAKLDERRKRLAEKLKAATSAEGNAKNIEALEAKIAEAREELGALEIPALGIEELQAKLEDLSRRIHNGQGLIAQVRLVAEGEEKRAELREQLEEAELRAGVLEHLVELFGPGPEGIRAKLLRENLSLLQERAATNLYDLTAGKYVADIRLEPDFHIVVRQHAGPVVGLRQLSTSERMRVGIAFAEALAHLSGLKMLVIDDAEILDLDNRALLTSFLLSLMDEFDTMILLSTSNKERVADPGVDGISVYWLEDGKLERVGEKVGAAS